MNDRDVNFSRRRSWLVLAIALLATIVSLCLLARSRPETSIVGLLDPSDPSVVALGKVLDQFPVVEELLLLVSVPDNFADDARSELLKFAEEFESRSTSDAEAKTAITAVRYRASPDMRAFVAEVVAPHGLDYLDDEGYAQLLAKLSRPAMDEQFAQNRSMLSVPGPAAGEIAKAFIRDPLRLRDLLTAQLGKRIANGPSMAGDAFFSRDGRSLLLRISGAKPPSDLDFCRQITKVATRVAGDANANGSLKVDVAGAYAIAAHSVDAIRHDSIVGTNVTIVAIAAVFLLLYRRPIRQFAFAFVPMAIGLILGFGAYASFHSTFTPLAAVVGGALGGVGINYGVFFLAHYDRARFATGGSTESAARTTLVRLRWPLFAAWATSVVGFLAIAFSPVRVLRDFAILGTLALLGAYLTSITVLPAALALLDRRRTPAAVAPARLGGLAPIGLFIARHAKLILAGSIGVWLALVASFAIGGASLLPDANLLSLHPQPNPPLDAQRRIASRMGIAPGTAQLYLTGDSPDSLLRTAHEVDRRLNDPRLKAAGCTGSFGIASLLPDPATSERRRAEIDPKLADRAAADLLAAASAAGFQAKPFDVSANFIRTLLAPTRPAPSLSTLQEQAADGRPKYADVAQLLLSHDSIAGGEPRAAMVMVFFDNPLDRRAPRDAAIRTLHDALDGTPGVVITGMSAINDHVEASIYRDLPKLVAFAIVCIAITLWLHFRSLGLALLAVLPTIVSITVVLTFMRITALPLDIVNMVMVPLLLGIDVDYSILTISAFRAARSRDDLARAFPTTAAAVATCVATTLVGFGSLVTTSVPAVRSLGMLITVGVISCLTASMTVLWPILFLMRRDGDSDARASERGKDAELHTSLDVGKAGIAE
jgi:predicted RND superfamily exporter protein